MKEQSANIHGLTEIPQPYQEWVSQRNYQIGRILTEMIGETITVATRPVTRDEVPKGLFYGTVVEDPTHVHKDILHPSTLDSEESFAQRLRMGGLVLPGVRVTSPSEVCAGYKKLKKGATVRAKQVDCSDGQGQYKIGSKREAKRIARKLQDVLDNQGMILESQIKDPKTISIGFGVIGDEQYSFIAHQRDEKFIAYDPDLDEDTERNRYMGADVTVARGDISSLRKLESITQEEQKAIDTAQAFYALFKEEYGIRTTRISFDYMYGNKEKRFGRKGGMIGGITDITARPGGTDPALVLAARELQKDPSLTSVSATVKLDYTNSEEVPENATMFIADPDLVAFAYITSKTGLLLPEEVAA